MRSFLIISSLLFSYSTSRAQSLQQHQWKDRVILIFANSEDNGSYQEQLQLLHENEAELIDRDLVVYRILDQKAIQPGGKPMIRDSANALTSRYKGKDKPFVFVLIGKDGGVKMRSDQVVEMDKLFALIDGMPMRRAEMKKRGKG